MAAPNTQSSMQKAAPQVDAASRSAPHARIELAATPAQQEVLQRIHAQRDALRARREKRKAQEVLAVAQGQRVDPSAPMAQRLFSFGRLHPVLSIAVLGVTAVAGPRRLLRWSSWLLPAALRIWRP